MGGLWNAGVVLAAAALAGCASLGSTHHPNAFSAKKTYAVVSVMASDKVGSGGMLAALKKTDAPAAAANDIMERTYPSALRALRASNLKITDAKGHKFYRAMAEDEQPKGPLSNPHIVAKGYKYFSDEKLVKLARELKVDGVITMTLSYDAARSAAGTGGHKAQTTVTVKAIDQNGKTVWSDSATGESGRSVPEAAGAADFPKLRPLFAESTDKAARKLMENFAAKTKM
jgi:hypothetical protein